MSFYSITLCACETFPHDMFNCAHDYFCAYVGVFFFCRKVKYFHITSLQETRKYGVQDYFVRKIRELTKIESF